METIEKLKILSQDSQYDLACACGTTKEDRRRRGLDGKWLYPVTLPQGGYSILLKTLLSNHCLSDCKYCPLRAENNIIRCSLQPEELAKIFIEYVIKNKVAGIFLSSGVIGSADNTMDKINSTAKIIREKYKYKGYIHLKIIPGASDAAIEESLSLANTVSLNIETPGQNRLKKLSLNKNYLNDIIRPLKLISKLIEEKFAHKKVKCTTQFIVGASDETDSEIINYTFNLYNKLRLQRVYFSAYQKGLGDSSIPAEQKDINPHALLNREHRLYQVDFLIRKYNFKFQDIIFESNGNLSLDKDPKLTWAEQHPEFFPVNINKADKWTLLRIPGIGPKTAELILKNRRYRNFSCYEELGLNRNNTEKIKKFVIFS
ncbi:MAG: radical SAM protein [Thermodesulfovibrionales bacterium]|nr:radical SAM protein [Thermodesulfovibrionales bacterium]